MKRVAKMLGEGVIALGRQLPVFRRETGRSLTVWAAVAGFHFATQIVFRRNLNLGEFAALNTLLGLVALLTVPAFALHEAFAHFQPAGPGLERLDAVKRLRGPVMLAGVVAWALVATLLLFPLLALLWMPRFLLGPFTLPAVLIGLGAFVSATIYESQHRLRLWGFLLFGAALVRFLLAWGMTGSMPWAESGLTAIVLAGLLLLTPLVRQTEIRFEWDKAREILRDREFVLYFAATLSVMLGIFLFSSADRIVAQAWFGRPQDNNLGLVRWDLFDGYQTAGLLGRGLLWGTQPLLLIFFAQRAREEHTSSALRGLMLVYGLILMVGAIVLGRSAQPLSQLFGGGDADATAHYIPSFALAMVPMGLLQGVGIFALASRRYPECFTLGGASLFYTLLLWFFGRPQLILSYIFGAGVAALMLVLFVGVVRWGRRQP